MRAFTPLMAMLALASCAPAYAATVPLSSLPARGTPVGTDIFPILPAGSSQLQSVLFSGIESTIQSAIVSSGQVVTQVTAGAGLSGGTITGSGTISLNAPVPVDLGGVGVETLTAHGVVIGEGAAAVDVTSPGTSGQCLISGGASADPGWGVCSTATGSVTSVVAGTGLTGGTITSSGAIALAIPVSVADGGTGASALTAHGVLVGEGAGAVTPTAVGAAGQVLTSNGSGNDPTWQGLPSNPYNPGLPQTSAWSAFNSSLMTVAEASVTPGGYTQAITLSSTFTSGSNLMGLYRAAPSTPYRIVIYVAANFAQSVNGAGVGYYDPSSGKLEVIGIFGCQTSGCLLGPLWLTWTNFTTPVSSTYAGQKLLSGYWVAIADNGTTVSFEQSSDSVNWTVVATDTHTGGFMPNYNNAMIFISPSSDPNGASAGLTFTGTFFTYDENGLSRTLSSVY